ncbi:UDP-glycosyltransferase [Quillaja saponaria]|uniref:UDP-glycosyltransferase n=1 Tax=Quillaja saponaria TaxID=32244 RepID=A0AAD7KPQ5_QUISA|nr:UDP-glycosyltransferase [Quillaja saponaria]
MDSKLHVVMFPWLAFGHMIPYLELAKLIARKGHLISFVSTPRNIDRLPKLPPNLEPLITFVKLPLPHVQNLPQNAEATTDVPYDVVPFLKLAYDGLQEPLIRFLESSDPDWILYDFAPYWLPPIASKLGIKTAFYSIFTASCLGFLGPPSVMMGDDEVRKTPESFTVSAPWVPFPTTVAFRYFEFMRVADFISHDSTDVTDMYRFGACIKYADIVAVRSCSEFEPEWLQVVENIYEKPVFPVGQLPTTAYDTGEETDTWWLTKSWLDKQIEGSVVYVAFGSEAKPSQEELTEIAHGLEKSELPFFWVFRNRRGPCDKEVIELPEGFEERTKGRGLVCKSWAPQLKILAHDSVGGFLTHSGWSSVVEAIQYEKSLILLTFLADQGLNARVLEEKNMGYSIPRNERDGSFTSGSVAESIRLVMVKEEGKIYREKIKEFKELFVNKDRQYKYVDIFLDYLITHKVASKE